MSENLKSKTKKRRTGIWKRAGKAFWEILPHALRRQIVAMSGQTELDF